MTCFAQIIFWINCLWLSGCVHLEGKIFGEQNIWRAKYLEGKIFGDIWRQVNSCAWKGHSAKLLYISSSGYKWSKEMVPDAGMEEFWSQQECSIIFQFEASPIFHQQPSIPEHITHPRYSQNHYKHIQLNIKKCINICQEWHP